MINIDISKQLYGANGNINLEVKLNIKKGEFMALSGESGSGKTTLFRILAGLENSHGTIKVDDNYWQNHNMQMPPQKRKIGFVFQDYALFSNMNVQDNLLFVKKDKKLAKKLLDITELSNLKNRFPNTLSGGQKQRVSLCRAMMNNPDLLLLDEPLSSLDAKMRTKLQNEILNLHNEFKTTTIMVSHDPSEIYHLCSRVVVLKNGIIINDGSPKEVLLKTNGSQKFSFEGKLLDKIKIDVIYVAIISIGQQLVEIVISEQEAKELKIGQTIRVGTKAFAPNICF